MPLVSLTELFERAHSERYALGYFEAWDLYSLEAALGAAEAEESPVILGFGCMMADRDWLDQGGVEALGAMGRVVADRAQVPVALLLNEAQTLDQALRGVESGFNAVMLDTSAWGWDDAVTQVGALARAAHARGVAVEGELGRLPDFIGGDVDESQASFTDPQQAAAFVAQTGVDCLAVSIGNVHLLTTRHAPVNLEHLEAIARRSATPLVIHGGTSFPPDAAPRAIAAGVVKFNVGTVLKHAFFAGLRQTMQAQPETADVHLILGSHKSADVMNAGKARMREKIRELMRVYGSSGRA
jgi:fructose-bisphosphate aldolase class II